LNSFGEIDGAVHVTRRNRIILGITPRNY